MAKQHKKVAEKPITSQTVYTVDSFVSGVEFGKHIVGVCDDPREQFSLALPEHSRSSGLRSRYSSDKEDPLHKLEHRLSQISKKGTLGRSHFVFGVNSDPFYPYEQKFENSVRFLELFARYRPGVLSIQTRSPLIVLAMPQLAALGSHVEVTMGIETNRDSVVARLTPELPRASERLKAIRALRNLGVAVNIQVAPLLPYGHLKRDAADFASQLISHARYIFIESIHTMLRRTCGSPRSNVLCDALVCSGDQEWLTKDCSKHLEKVIKLIAPQKLEFPERKQIEQKQMELL